MASMTKGLPQKFNVNKVPGKPKKRKHITLTFDEGKRREFLGGFHKRKLQRQKKAQEELQRQLKEDKKKIKQDARERYKTLLSQRDVPELEELLSRQEYESEGRTVSILELNVADLAQKNNWIGENKVTYEDDDDEEEIGEEEPRAMDEIAGMELKERKSKTKAPAEFAESSEAFGSKKEVKHAIKRAALKQVQKSKAFRLKQKLEGQKNRKEMLRKKRKNDKILSKKQKGKSKKKSR